YKELDKQRKLYGEKIRSALEAGKFFYLINDLYSSPHSIKFYAVEDVLFNLINEERYKEDVKKLFNILGYVTFYEKKLKCRNIITRASAIDKLGKMLSALSTYKLISMFKSKNPEIISVTVRSLSNIGTTEALKGILEYLPDLYEKWLITRKVVETSLLKFGQSAVPILLEYGRRLSNPKILAIILDVLSHLDDKMSLPLAIDNLKHESAEVRAKSLKIIEALVDKLEDSDIVKVILLLDEPIWLDIGDTMSDTVKVMTRRVLSLLDDPVWFVRLYAVKALGKMQYLKATAELLGGLLLDENWQVRNAAAITLTRFDTMDAIDTFLRVLRYNDRYAKEIVCEEIEKTNFVYKLIENLGSSDKNIYEKSKEILNIMHSLNFSTPLYEYMKNGRNDKIKGEINLILIRKQRYEGIIDTPYIRV
ncbi:MAG: HEAT repeat domain-containing protein, partial [Candidatus Omnitrophica bacterium]|nr:HEAT repeat domain-containing protein [Candidatus Omnitrophota bacterium]